MDHGHLLATSQGRLKEGNGDEYSIIVRKRVIRTFFCVQYTASMPLDVRAEVIANRRLSSDYNVVALAAPHIAEAAAPGQFVMVKASRGRDPLLRRPFSLFEVLRDGSGAATGFSLLNKPIRVTTSRLFDLRPGDVVDCLGPLGRPFTPVDPPTRAWMVAGGVGLAPFVVLAEALRARRAVVTLFYGARSGAELFYLDVFEGLGVELVLATEDGSRGETGRVTLPLERRLAALAPADAAMIYACGPEGMLAATARLASKYGRRSEVSVERTMGCGMGGCYSCVVALRDGHGAVHNVRSCLSGPVLAGDRIQWD